jgi:hypothetical protein
MDTVEATAYTASVKSLRIAGDATLYAVWTVNKYNLDFLPNGAYGTPVSIYADYNSVVTLPGIGDMYREGYTFGGWETIEGVEVSSPYLMPLGGGYLYAIWDIIQYEITWNWETQDGPQNAKETLEYDTMPAKTISGYQTETVVFTFVGWSPEIVKVAGDKTYTAQYSSAPRQYTITFDSAGGTAVASMTRDYGSTVTAPAAPTKTGYSFTGWSPVLPETIPVGDTTVTATWTINQYTITFDSAGGTAVTPMIQDYDSAVTAPADPTRAGYSFAGWTPALPEKMPAENRTVTATWSVNKYTITFVSGGTAVVSMTRDYGSSVTTPVEPTKTGYSFAGWTPALPETMPAENRTVTATWTINQYTLTFSANGGTGSVPAAITADYNSAVPLPEAGSLVRAGYTFGGWSHNTSGSTLLTPYTVKAVDETLYAVWNIVTYSELPSSAVISDIIGQDSKPVLQVTGNAVNGVLDNSLFENLGSKPLTVDVVDDEGQVQYSWTFDGEYKEGAGTFKAGISEVTPEDELSSAISSTGAENPLVLSFEASGELPINATLKYYVGAKYADGTKLTLFFYNEETKQLEVKEKDLVVTDGWVELSITHCSSYVLAEPAPASAPEDNIMLYAGIGLAAVAILGAVAFLIIRRR